MGGSQSKQTDKEQDISPAVVEAFKRDNQAFLQQDVFKNLEKFSSVFKDFSRNDVVSLMNHVSAIGTEFKNGDSPVKLSQDIQNSLVTFHEAILHGIDETLSDEERNKKYLELINNPEAPQSENIIRLLSQKYGTELDDHKNEIMKDYEIHRVPELEGNINSIFDSVKSMKVKYKFFEYKYIELNIFLILFVQHFYNTIDSFVTNIMDFNKKRDENRDIIVKSLIDTLKKILNDAKLDIDPSNVEEISTIVDKLREYTQQKDREMNERITNMIVHATQGMTDFLNKASNVSNAASIQMVNQNKPSEMRGGNKLNKNKKKGGFIKGSSMMPTSFYKL